MMLESITLFDRENIQVFQNRPHSIGAFIHQSVEVNPSKLAVVSEEESLTYKELEDRARRIAITLTTKYGVQKGDRLAILMGNGIDFPTLVYASALMGSILVPVNIKLASKEIAYILSHSESKLLVYHADLTNIAEAMDMIEKVAFQNISSEGIEHEKLSFPEIEETDPAYILYTSGTTGRPKGAVLSHVNVIHSVMNYKTIFGTNKDYTTLIAVPMFHVTGLVGQLLHQLYNGATMYSMKKYQNETYIQLVLQHQINFLFNVPTIFVMMSTTDMFKENDFSFVKKVAYGGSPIYQQTFQLLKRAFPNAELHNAYGSTETTSPATLMPRQYDIDKVRSAGQPVHGAEIKVIDENGATLKAGQTGEICIRGAMVIKGYWKNEEANLAGFSDGYWLSGDIGTLDEENFIYILDRKKDMINRGGEKIFSIEVEDVLKSHPDILEAAVVGEPDEIYGEIVKAYIVSNTLSSESTESIRAYCLTKLAKYKVPSKIMIIKELPRNASGKILKKSLK